MLGMSVVALLAGGKWVNVEKQRTRNGTVGKIAGLIVSLFIVTLLHSKYTPSFALSGDTVFYAVALLKAAMIPCFTFLPYLFFY